MNFTVESKSQLAKLMATENINIVHKKMSTAMFDVKKRTLYLPIWSDMNGNMYDLLCGHEVGHALYTPAEGWHDVVADKSKKNLKSFINVVEDARIEKRIKRKYPGLKNSFQKAYSELMNRDFFGIKGRDINSLPFIDRLNLFTKSQYTMDIKFNDVELTFVKRVESLETWEETVKLSNEIYDYAKSEMEDDMSTSDLDDCYSDENDDDMNDDYSDDSESENSESKDKENGDDSESEDDIGTPDETDSDENDDEIDVSEGELNRQKESTESIYNQFTPRCETDENFRERESSLVDESCKDYIYIDVPTPRYENIITPAKRVQEQISDYYLNGRFTIDQANNLVSDFKSKNERYISLLVKEFEMKKAAKSYSKSKLSDTGDIDISKLASYKFDDNIFRKMMVTPKGKNHGLILLLDKSGSMYDNLAGSIEQILVLTMFCRKVNIPFIVYGFGDAYDAFTLDRGSCIDRNNDKCFSQKNNEICLSNVRLREYLNSKMNNAEFNNCIRNMIMLKKAFESGNRYYGYPESESLSNTPLISAIFATGKIMNEFRKKYNLDKTSLIIVHDGDSDNCSSYNIEQEDGSILSKHFSTWSQNVIIRDKNMKYESKIKGDDYGHCDMFSISLEWFKKYTGSKVFGFFILPTNRKYVKDSISRRFVYENGDKITDRYNRYDCREAVNEIYKKLKKDKFIDSKNKGYNSFYLVSGGDDLNTENEQIEIDGKVTTSKLKSAFVKMNKKRAVNRVLVSKFVQGFAA